MNIEMPSRSKHANKGDFGHVAIIAGSDFMPGAAIISAASAYKVGAGKVTLFSTEKVCNQAVVYNPQIMIHNLESQEGYIFIDDCYELAKKINSCSVLLLGPGLGCNSTTAQWFEALIRFIEVPIIFDADALNLLNSLKISPTEKAILTPHIKEMAVLTNSTIDIVKRNQKITALYYANKYKVTTVLKGSETFVVTNNQVYNLNRPTSSLAKAGTGDCLAGMIAGLFAQNKNQHKAACLAVDLHNYISIFISQKETDYGVEINQIIDAIPYAIKNKIMLNVE